MGSGLDDSKLYKETMRDNFGINSDDLPDSKMMSMKKIKKTNYPSTHAEYFFTFCKRK